MRGQADLFPDSAEATRRRANEADELARRIRHILQETAEIIRPCKACGTQLYLVRGKSGKRSPYESDGTNHFTNCPAAATFSSKR